MFSISTTAINAQALWEGRYQATVIDTEQYLLSCSRYIELNPVRAGLVTHPSEYPWSSYHGNARGRLDGLLSEHPLYLALGRSKQERQAAYRGLFRSHISEETVTYSGCY